MGFNVNVIGGGKVQKIYSDTPIMGHEVLSFTDFGGKGSGLVMAWRVNRILRPMSWVVDDEADVEFVDTSSFEGAEIYRSTLTFLLALACKRALDRDVSVKYSMSDSYSANFKMGRPPRIKSRASRKRWRRWRPQHFPSSSPRSRWIKPAGYSNGRATATGRDLFNVREPTRSCSTGAPAYTAISAFPWRR
ncbi:MAG: hypothetical protein LBG12_09585, partial [Synergistaceae bacterium]|nr:hypothetical protein [Synergistaceae bacterium]